jgi:hypothetical protein
MERVLTIPQTQINTPAQNVGVSAAITAASNIYYGTIYAYTPEILPSAHRATGYGMCVVLNRVGGITGVLIGSYANVETTAPLFVCASLFGLLVFLSLLLPFETRGKRSNWRAGMIEEDRAVLTGKEQSRMARSMVSFGSVEKYTMASAS